jgi:hypothetical protein
MPYGIEHEDIARALGYKKGQIQSADDMMLDNYPALDEALNAGYVRYGGGRGEMDFSLAPSNDKGYQTIRSVLRQHGTPDTRVHIDHFPLATRRQRTRTFSGSYDEAMRWLGRQAGE